MDYRYESTFNQCKGKIDLLNAYIIGDYKSVIKLCEESVDFKNKEDKLAMYNHSMYQLGKAKEIKWLLNLDESNLHDQTGIYSLINLLTYHLIEDNDEQLSSYLKELFQSLAEKNLHHLMRFGYHFLCQDIKFVQV